MTTASGCRCLACIDPHGYYCPNCGPDDEVRCDGSRKPRTKHVSESVDERTRCRCWWRGERCKNRATQEDGLCNWCGNGRTPEQMLDDPSAILGPDGTFLGIGGGGQLHDSRPGSPGACWYPDSDRVIAA